MLVKSKCDDYVVYTKGNGDNYKKIFTDFIHNRLTIEKVFRNIEDTKVMLVNFDSKQYVLKVFKPREKRAERFLKSFFKGDYYLNLMKKTDELWSKGVQFPNDFYLLAEKKIFNYASLFIMVIEYIPGEELSAYRTVPDTLKQEIVTSISRLHENGMVSGDPHKGNFIVSDSGLRLIDLSGKKLTKRRIAKDYIDLERHIGINEFDKNFYYHWVKRRSQFRKRFKAFKATIKRK